MNRIDVDKIKGMIDDNSIKTILLSFGARAISENNEQIIFPSICHHIDFENHKNKLYYYKNGSFFLCYSCSSSGDIFWLVQKRKELLGEKCSFPQAIKYVCDILGIDCGNINTIKETNNLLYDWSGLTKYLKNAKNHIFNKEYDKSILEYFPQMYHDSFIKDHISVDTMKKFGLRYYPYKQQILIPTFDDESKFIGVHCRNLEPRLIEMGYKYIPLEILTGEEYKFNTSNVLYGLNMNKMFIQHSKEVIITEAPKGVMQLDSYGYYNSVGLFGRVLQKQKLKLLLKYGVEKFTIALDKQYHNKDTEEFENKYCKVLNKIIDSVRPYAKEINVVWDYDDNMLGYCDSPMDKGKDIWNELYKNKERIV